MNVNPDARCQGASSAGPRRPPVASISAVSPVRRRQFLKSAAAGLGGFGLPLPAPGEPEGSAELPAYGGPKVILIRFGGGVRRRETIEPAHTYAPYLLHELCPRGTLFPQMEIAPLPYVQTSHGPGTLNILTGVYDRYQDVLDRPIGERYEPNVPTLFEYLRKQYAVAEHEALIVNGEDRIDEEFYTFSNHHLFGVRYRSSVLSLYRFKIHLLRRRLALGQVPDKEVRARQRQLRRMEALDHRVGEGRGGSVEIAGFWERWREYYGETGLVNPRGDRLLAELAVRALRELRPKLLMVNFNDPDYVHWGNLSHYTRGIQIMDECVRRIVEAAEADDHYRGDTVFVIVPDCGRDDNRTMAVPCQHHFGTPSSRQIFALLFGPGIARAQRVDRPADQISVAATVGALMGFRAEMAQGPALEEAFA